MLKRRAKKVVLNGRMREIPAEEQRRILGGKDVWTTTGWSHANAGLAHAATNANAGQNNANADARGVAWLARNWQSFATSWNADPGPVNWTSS